MKYCIACLAALVLALCFSGVSSAHKVNVFAYVDGEAIQVECYFTRSQKVRQGKLTVTDLATAEKLLEGTTDEQGLFRFQPDPAFLKTGHAMHILLNAGEGHQNSWEIYPEELAALSPPVQSAKPAVERTAPAEQAPPATLASREPGAVTLDAAGLEALLGKVLDAKLAPLKQTLARQADSGPNLRDVIGGIGWIIGLLGLAAYMKYRR
jgi:nickel transport protein